MVKKYVRIEFANPSIRAINCLEDIRKAILHASRNLYTRHHVVMDSIDNINYDIIIGFLIPAEIADDFAIGNHLRGIASYLLRNNPEKYYQYKVGKRLLTYTEIPKPDIYDYVIIDNREAIELLQQINLLFTEPKHKLALEMGIEALKEKEEIPLF